MFIVFFALPYFTAQKHFASRWPLNRCIDLLCAFWAYYSIACSDQHLFCQCLREKRLTQMMMCRMRKEFTDSDGNIWLADHIHTSLVLHIYRQVVENFLDLRVSWWSSWYSTVLTSHKELKRKHITRLKTAQHPPRGNKPTVWSGHSIAVLPAVWRRVESDLR